MTLIQACSHCSFTAASTSLCMQVTMQYNREPVRCVVRTKHATLRMQYTTARVTLAPPWSIVTLALLWTSGSPAVPQPYTPLAPLGSSFPPVPPSSSVSWAPGFIIVPPSYLCSGLSSGSSLHHLLPPLSPSWCLFSIYYLLIN